MCVIIFKPKDKELTRNELESAWDVNPDGAGFAYPEAGAVVFQKAFMNKSYFIDRVMELQDKDLLLHLRISTCAGVTPNGTHPYKLGNLNAIKAKTRNPVICMNGVISGQKLHKKQGVKLNDTASYILDHKDAFNVINADILNLIEDNTGSKWAVMKPEGVILSNGFIEEDGIYYSNLNHKNYLHALQSYLFDYTETKYAHYNLEPADVLPHDVLVNAPEATLWDLQDYMYFKCNKGKCYGCKGCVYDIKTVKDAKTFINQNMDKIDYSYGGY